MTWILLYHILWIKNSALVDSSQSNELKETNIENYATTSHKLWKIMWKPNMYYHKLRITINVSTVCV